MTQNQQSLDSSRLFGLLVLTAGALAAEHPGTWDRSDDMTVARGWVGSAVVDDLIYVFGGDDSAVGASVPWVEAHSVASGVRKVTGRVPIPKCAAGVGVVNGTVYLPGGFDSESSASFSSLTTYDPDRYSYWAQAAAHQPGLYGSLWQTDLAVVNDGDETAEVEVILHSADGPGAPSDTVDPGAQLVLDDVVGAMGVTGKGSLEVRSSQPLSVSGRTFPDVGAGTFGQVCQLGAMHNGLVKGDTVWLPGLRQETGRFRTNLTFTNTGRKVP